MTRRALSRLAGLLLAVGLGVWSPPVGAAEAGRVVGVVFDARTGLPVPDASVELAGTTVRTDAFGAFEVALESGAVALSAGLPGADRVGAGHIPVVAGATTEVLLTLDASGGAPAVVVEAPASATPPADDEPAVLAPVTGRVVDEDGRPLAGARLYVRGWRGEAQTGEDGGFQLQVPVGHVALSVLRSGYAARNLDALEVPVSGVSGLHVELVQAGLALEEFRVTVPRLEGGESTLLAERQDSSDVVDSLSAEQMSRRGDSSAASALRRVTGLTVVGGKYVYVRGLGERYSASLFNGSTLPSPEPSRRVVPLDLFPTAMLESVLIQKTYSAAMPGEFGGGVVRLRTKGVPDAPLLRVSLRGRYQDGTTFTDGVAGDRGPTDGLGFGSGHRALPEALRRATEDTPLQLRSNLPGSQGFTADELEQLGEAFPNRWGLQQAKAMPDLSTSVVAGRGWDIGDDRRLGVIAGSSFRNGWDRLEYDSSVYTLDGTRLAADKSYRFEELTNTVGLSGILHVSADLGEDHHLSSTTTLTRDSESYALRGYGYEDDIGTDTRRERTRWVERQLLVEQLAGEHRIHGLRDLETRWRYALSLADRLEPDRRDILMQPATDGDGWFLRYQGGGHGIFFSELGDSVHDGAVDLSLPWGETDPDVASWRGALMAGGQRMSRTRGVDVRRFRYDILGGGSDAGFLYSEPEDIFTAENISDQGLRVAEGTLSTDNYTATHDIQAVYLQADTTAPWGTGLLVGTRLERSVQEARTFQLFSEDSTPVIGRLATTDVLPGVTLTQPLSGHGSARPMQLRAGYGRTVNRPDLRELSPSTYFDPRTQREVVGNPDLARARIDNVDLRWEWYLSPDESLSVAGFAKRFEDPIEVVIEVGAAGRQTFANAAAARNNGLEVDLRKALGRQEGGPLDPVYLGVNGAWISSSVDLGEIGGSATSRERPLQGQSPWVVNLQLSYEPGSFPLSGALLYNASGPRITQVGTNGVPDQVALPVHRLDAVASWDLGSGWGLRASGRNLLDSPQVEVVGDETALSVRTGWQVGLGVSWRAEADR